MVVVNLILLTQFPFIYSTLGQSSRPFDFGLSGISLAFYDILNFH